MKNNRSIELIYWQWILVLSVCLLSSCKIDDDGHSSKPNYAIRNLDASTLSQYSILPELHKNGGKLSIQIISVSSQPLLNNKDVENLKKSIHDAVQSWNHILYEKSNGIPWSWSNLDVNITGPEQSHPCQHYNGVNWNCPDDNKVRFFIHDDRTARSYTNPLEKYIAIHASNVTTIHYSDWHSKSFNKLILHEYGHILGLSDTYIDAKYQTPENSPPAIMNSYYEVDTFTEDDIVGIRTLWDFLNFEGDICAPGYVDDKAEVNAWQARFCIPADNITPESHEWQWEPIDENHGISIGPDGERIEKCKIEGQWRECSR